MNNQVRTKTRSSYDSKIQRLVVWLGQHHPQHIENQQRTGLPLPVQILEEFLGFISQHEDGTKKSVSDVNGYMSAINNLYRSKLIICPQTKTTMSSFIAGYKRIVATAKQTGEMKLTEGKQPFTFDTYKLLAGKAIIDPSPLSITLYGHPYLVLCWNLMARSCSVALIMYTRITWSNDSLVITLPRHKGDQEGSNAYPKHVFANPLSPEVE